MIVPFKRIQPLSYHVSNSSQLAAEIRSVQLVGDTLQLLGPWSISVHLRFKDKENQTLQVALFINFVNFWMHIAVCELAIRVNRGTARILKLFNDIPGMSTDLERDAISINSLDFWLHFAVCELALRTNQGTTEILKQFNDIPDMSTEMEHSLAPEIRSVQLVGDTLQLLGPWSFSVHLRFKDKKNSTLQMLGVLLVSMHFHLAVLFIYRSLWIINRELLRIVNLSVHGATESTRVHELQCIYKRLLELNLRIVAIYDYQITLLMMSLLTMNIIFPFFTLVYTISLQNPVTIHVVLNFLQAMSISSLDFWLHFAVFNMMDFWLHISVCELAVRTNKETATILRMFNDIPDMGRDLERSLVPEIRSVQLVGDTLQLQGLWSFSFHLRCKDEKNSTLQVVGWIRNHLERDCGLGRMDKHSGNRISYHTADF
ncbi:hypothetical protein ACLKA7_002691 [Drosophila subpalustris]